MFFVPDIVGLICYVILETNHKLLGFYFVLPVTGSVTLHVSWIFCFTIEI